MKIALLGYGKMGQLIERIAVERGHTIVSKINSQTTGLKDIRHALQDAHVCIDFSHPECVMENIKIASGMKKNLVVGTTGWYESVGEVKKIVEDNNTGLLYSPNFSLGVNVFMHIVAEAARVIDEFSEYDVGMFESHHNKKADSPSGTALAIAQAILDNMTRKQQILTHLPNGKIPEDALQISSLRCGSIPGTHSVIFDSKADTITLTHEARNREGFALGAVTAAEWLENKKGFYTLQDLFRG